MKKTNMMKDERAVTMHYYAYLNDQDVVEMVMGLPSVITDPHYISIETDDQSLVGKWYNRETGQFEDKMFYYAVLDEKDIVTEVIALPSQITDDKKILISTYDQALVGKWYDRAAGKFTEVPIHILAKLNTGEISTLKADGTPEDKWLYTELEELRHPKMGRKLVAYGSGNAEATKLLRYPNEFPDEGQPMSGQALLKPQFVDTTVAGCHEPDEIEIWLSGRNQTSTTEGFQDARAHIVMKRNAGGANDVLQDKGLYITSFEINSGVRAEKSSVFIVKDSEHGLVYKYGPINSDNVHLISKDGYSGGMQIADQYGEAGTALAFVNFNKYYTSEMDHTEIRVYAPYVIGNEETGIQGISFPILDLSNIPASTVEYTVGCFYEFAAYSYVTE